MKDFIISNDQSDKKVFVKCYDFIKAKKTRAKNLKELYEIESSIKNEMHRREHKILIHCLSVNESHSAKLMNYVFE